MIPVNFDDIIYNIFSPAQGFGQSLFNAFWPWLWVVLGIIFVGIIITLVIDRITDMFENGFSNAPFGISYKIPEFKSSGFMAGGNDKFSPLVPGFGSKLFGSRTASEPPPKRYVFEHNYSGWQPMTGKADFNYNKTVWVKGGLSKTYDNLDKPNTQKIGPQFKYNVGGLHTDNPNLAKVAIESQQKNS